MAKRRTPKKSDRYFLNRFYEIRDKFQQIFEKVKKQYPDEDLEEGSKEVFEHFDDLEYFLTDPDMEYDLRTCDLVADMAMDIGIGMGGLLLRYPQEVMEVLGLYPDHVSTEFRQLVAARKAVKNLAAGPLKIKDKASKEREKSIELLRKQLESNARLTLTAARKNVARILGISERTVVRHTKGITR